MYIESFLLPSCVYLLVVGVDIMLNRKRCCKNSLASRGRASNGLNCIGIVWARIANPRQRGEIGADLDLNTKGYESLQIRLKDIDAPGHNGIDGVYRKNGEFFIVEGKYTGSASLKSANKKTGLPRQMSDDWIRRPGEMEKALGPGNEILARSILRSDYKRILAKVAPDGSVTYRLVDSQGKVIRGNAGIFNP
ncbi:hypothetical protein DMA11_12720 [Marinilabiliaceae bacterium JC017]|nr:hypothetical protein DMA11_12720 [Marinilabiliaceae bacterium JC017]